MPIDRRAIYDRDGGLCGFCGEPVPWELMHLDHIQPRGLDGPTDMANLRVAHRLCNLSAGSAVRVERRRRGLPRVEGTSQSVRDVDPETWRHARVAALARGVTVGTLLNTILREWLKANPE